MPRQKTNNQHKLRHRPLSLLRKRLARLLDAALAALPLTHPHRLSRHLPLAQRNVLLNAEQKPLLPTPPSGAMNHVLRLARIAVISVGTTAEMTVATTAETTAAMSVRTTAETIVETIVERRADPRIGSNETSEGAIGLTATAVVTDVEAVAVIAEKVFATEHSRQRSNARSVS
ncbi:MAG: hypothetical protein RIR53_1552 [Bacteroidota bacterium]